MAEDRRNISLSASIFLVSAGVLVFETALVRVFALAYWHHFASILISLALTGFGAAGSVTAAGMNRLEKRPRLWLTVAALAAAFAMPAAHKLTGAVDFLPPALAWSQGAWLQLALICLILIVPFFLAASLIAMMLAWAGNPGATYAANLTGSAFGCLLAALALARLLPQQAVSLAAGLCALGALFLLTGTTRRRKLAVVALILVGAAWLFWRPPALYFAPFKDRAAAMSAAGNQLKARSPGLKGLVEIIGGPTYRYAPGLALGCPADLPPQDGLFVDGDMVGPLTKLSPSDGPPAFLNCLMAHIPYPIFQPKRVLVLRPNAGLAVWTALAGGAASVTAVEDNQRIHGLLTRDPWAGASGRLGRRPGVNLVHAEPDRFLKRAGPGYDLIVYGHGGAWGEGSGLSVTRLMTVEALTAAMNRLTPQGLMVFSGPLMTPPRASIKMFATAVAALREAGADPAEGLAVIRDWNTVLILVKPSGFNPAQKAALRQAAADKGFDLAYLQGLSLEQANQRHVLPRAALYQACRAILSDRADEFFEDALFELRPARRDRPYFFHFFRRSSLPLILDPEQGRPLGALSWGLLFTWGALAAALVLAAAGIFAPLTRLRPAPRRWPYFAFLGLGFMLAEIAMINEAIYRLGAPALAVPLVIGVFLTASGAGSLLWGGKKPPPFAWAAAVLIPVSLLGVRHLPGGWWGAILILIAPALVMGALFAGGLTHLIGPSAPKRAWAFGVNGFFSVLGGLSAGLFCLSFGHLTAAALAAACYLAAGLAAMGGKS